MENEGEEKKIGGKKEKEKDEQKERRWEMGERKEEES